MRSSRISKLRMSIRLLTAAVTRRRSRLWIALQALTLGAAVISALVSVYLEVGVKMRKELRAYGANVAAAAPAGSFSMSVDSFRAALQTVPPEKLVGAAPWFYGVVRVGEERLLLAGGDFSKITRVSPYWKIDGRIPEPGEALLGVTVAERLGKAIGDDLVTSVAAGDSSAFKVSGVLSTGEARDEQVLVSLEDAWGLLGRSGEIQSAEVSLIGEPEWIESWATSASSEVSFTPIRRISAAESNLLEKFRGLVFLMSAIILMLTLLCLMTTSLAMAAERYREFALKKALGAGSFAILAELAGENAALALAGGLAGWLAGIALAQGIGYGVFGTGVRVYWEVVPAVLGVSIVMTFAAGTLAARRALTVEPATVLKGE
jgi:putative ABC transport system permease protein